MSGNTFGEIFRVTTFGESHGTALGVIVDGCPSGIKIDGEKIQQALDRRKPGAKTENGFNAAVTARKEDDKAQILSGIFNGYSEGTPVAIAIQNTSQHSKDYSNISTSFRPGHADYTYFEKYGFRDYRGGGRSSGRETAARVAAGSIARQVLEHYLGTGFRITAYTLKAAGISCSKIDLDAIEKNPMRAADMDAALKMQQAVEGFRAAGNSAGGIIECRINGIPAGLGEPVFDKLDAELAKAMLSIGAVKGIEFGAGFAAADSNGQDNNDDMQVAKNSDGTTSVEFLTNNAGGILGGISNGNEIIFRIAVKPVPSIFTAQKTVCADFNPDVPAENEPAFADKEMQIQGRHDVCLCPRIVPVVEAMAAITLADMFLRNKSGR